MEKSIDLSERYTPVQSIMIYLNKNSNQYSSKQYYLESHDILIDKDGSSILLEGKPLRRSTLINLTKGLQAQTTKELQCKGIIPKNLIYFRQEIGNNRIIWFVPERKHNLFFTKDLNIPNGQAYTPALIFALQGQELSVFAKKGNRKPELKTKLFHAPFHNIHDDGKVCLGNAKLPDDKLHFVEEIIKAWEKVFWASEFSHLLGKNPIKSNLNTLYKSLIGSGRKFPCAELLPSTEVSTVEELLNAN